VLWSSVIWGDGASKSSHRAAVSMYWPSMVSKTKSSVLGLEKSNGPRSLSGSKLMSASCEAVLVLVVCCWCDGAETGPLSTWDEPSTQPSILGVCGRTLSWSFALFVRSRTLRLRSLGTSFGVLVLFHASYLDDHFSGRTYPGQSSAFRVHWLHCGTASSHLIFLCLQRRQPPAQR
jgi:hypothetical protein